MLRGLLRAYCTRSFFDDLSSISSSLRGKGGVLIIVTSTGQLVCVKIVGRRSVNFFILSTVSTIVVTLGSGYWVLFGSGAILFQSSDRLSFFTYRGRFKFLPCILLEGACVVFLGLLVVDPLRIHTLEI